MTTVQFEKILIENTKDLPKDALQEILDFIKFIRLKIQKEQINNLNAELSHLDKSQMNHLEEELKDYKQLYPIE